MVVYIKLRSLFNRLEFQDLNLVITQQSSISGFRFPIRKMTKLTDWLMNHVECVQNIKFYRNQSECFSIKKLSKNSF